MPAMREGRSCHGACRLDQKVYVFGGKMATSIEIFDAKNESWGTLSVELPVSNLCPLSPNLKNLINYCFSFV